MDSSWVFLEVFITKTAETLEKSGSKGGGVVDSAAAEGLVGTQAGFSKIRQLVVANK